MQAKRDFYWMGMRSDIKKYVKQCDTCQRAKVENTKPSSLLQPLPIPPRVWTSISMDFIKGLAQSAKYSTLFVIVDRLTKFAYFMTITHPYTAVKIVEIFINNVLKIHGMPKNIACDRDPTFTSKF